MMGDLQSEKVRYERKFLVDRLDEHQVRTLIKLHPSMFYEPYPPRYVNNIYLDSQEMESYFDNVGGVGDRKKVRIRWYGDLWGRIEYPVLEFKIKRGLVGRKAQYPFDAFVLDERFSDRYLRDVLRSADLAAHVKVHVRDLNAVLLNRYYRRYFATMDGEYRVTVDTSVTFYNIRGLRSGSVHKQVDHNSVVVELKYRAEHEWLADRVSGFFPFAVTKISKYVRGIERVFL